ncbi:hypothetical protein D9M68_780470 [compost metagenome]
MPRSSHIAEGDSPLRAPMATRAEGKSTAEMMRSALATARVVSARGKRYGRPVHSTPSMRLYRFARLTALYWSRSQGQKRCRTRLGSRTTPSSMMVTSRPYSCPSERMAWWKDARQSTTSLPFPPAPITTMRGARLDQLAGVVNTICWGTSFCTVPITCPPSPRTRP